MQITVNGTVDELNSKMTVRDYVEARNLRDEIIIVVINGEVIAKDAWGESLLKAGDSVEIIRVVGGG
jgi:sulfur carrier protein